MIARLTGTVTKTKAASLIVDVHGVGYHVCTPLRVFARIQDNETVVLHIHTHIREDAFDLFGFLSPDDLSLFELLLTVSGIGPKTALGVLDHEAAAVRHAIEAGDVDFFTGVPRLGKKNAQKIIIELRSKIAGVTGNLPEENSGETKELIDALSSMGFDRKEIRAILPKLSDGTIEQKIKHALKLLG